MVFKPRFYFLVGFLFCMGLLAAALYFQFSGGLEPCPLCVSQRIMVFAVALVMLVAVLHNPKRTGVKVYAILGFVMAVLGGTVSARSLDRDPQGDAERDRRLRQSRLDAARAQYARLGVDQLLHLGAAQPYPILEQFGCAWRSTIFFD